MLPPLDELEERRLLDDVERDRVRWIPDFAVEPVRDRVRWLPDFAVEPVRDRVRWLPDFASEPVRFLVPDERLRLELLERAALLPPCRERPERPASPPPSS